MAWNIDGDLKKVGTNLKRIRLHRNLDIESVAKAVKLTPQRLQQLEEGLYPDCRLKIIFDLIEYYGVTADEVFTRGKKPPKTG